MTRRLPFAGLVLAGGKSSRMGQDKAMLQYEGQTWLDRGTSLLQKAGAREILVNTRQTSEFPPVEEIYSDKGPLSGIHAGLLVTGLPLLVLAVDMPTLSLSHIYALLDKAEDYDCVYFTDSPLPCLLQNTPSVLQTVEAALTQTHNSKSLFANWKQLSSIEITAPGPLQNFNTPADISC